MTGFRGVLCLSMLTLALAACGSGGSGGDVAASSGSTSNEVFATPTAEGSGPESPQQPQDGGPVITAASLPVGGNKDVGADPTQQCVGVAILASPPDGVTLHVMGVKFDPDGVFELGGSACSGDATSCSFPTDVTAQSADSCSVSVQELPGARGHVSVTLAADVHCTTQDVCDGYRSTLDATPNQQGVDATQSGDGSGSAPVTDDPASSGT